MGIIERFWSEGLLVVELLSPSIGVSRNESSLSYQVSSCLEYDMPSRGLLHLDATFSFCIL